jgi:hypothetical protein
LCFLSFWSAGVFGLLLCLVPVSVPFLGPADVVLGFFCSLVWPPPGGALPPYSDARLHLRRFFLGFPAVDGPLASCCVHRRPLGSSSCTSPFGSSAAPVHRGWVLEQCYCGRTSAGGCPLQCRRGWCSLPCWPWDVCMFRLRRWGSHHVRLIGPYLSVGSVHRSGAPPGRPDRVLPVVPSRSPVRGPCLCAWRCGWVLPGSLSCLGF